MSETPLQVNKTNNWAIISLLLGIVGLLGTCCGGVVFPPLACVAILPAILAVVLGFIARREIKESMGTQTGEGLALAGIILGGLMVALFVLGCFVVMVLALTSESISEIFENISATLEAQQ
jgi:hypothetical protein